MIIYLAGPMTGIKDFNYPAFFAEADRLRAKGFDVRNPAEGPECATWEDYMRQALTTMMKCDTIRLLPGWTKSRGATIEFNLAEELGMRVIYPSQDVT